MEYWNMCESQRFLLIAREGMSPYYKTAAKRFLCVYKIYIHIYIYLRISVQMKNIILKSIEYPAFSMLRTHINFSF